MTYSNFPDRPVPSAPPPAAHAPVPTNGFAVASLVLGVLWLGWVGSFLAVIFGHIGLRQARQRSQKGDGLAIAGLILGYLGVGTFLVFFVLLPLAASGGGA